MDIFAEIMAFDEELNEVVWALDDAIAHLLPPAPDQVVPQQDPTHDPLPHLVYNSESEPDRDNELDPDLPWREVQDIPSFQLREAVRNTQLPIENDFFSFQNTTPPLNLIDNYDRDGL